MGVSDEQLSIIVDAYNMKANEFILSGQTYNINRINILKIFTHEIEESPKSVYSNAIEYKIAEKVFGPYYHIPPKNLAKIGSDITDKILKDGIVQSSHSNFLDIEKIQRLKGFELKEFDFKRLIQLCSELNDNFKNKNYLTVAILGRCIINHIPPIFGFNTFNEVSNNYGSQSFKKTMNHLNITMRSIADSFLHDTIRNIESIPSVEQINFSQDFDVLFSEILRILDSK